MHDDDTSFLAVPTEKWKLLESSIVSLRAQLNKLSKENSDLKRRLIEVEAEMAEVAVGYEDLMKRQAEVDQFIICRDRIREKLDSLLCRLELLDLPVGIVEQSTDRNC